MKASMGVVACASLLAPAMALLCTALWVEATAQSVNLGQYQHPRTDKDLEANKAYLMGAVDALNVLNQSLDQRQFCPPTTPPNLSFEQANSLVMRWASKTSGSADLSLGRTLLYALKQAYPCRP